METDRRGLRFVGPRHSSFGRDDVRVTYIHARMWGAMTEKEDSSADRRVPTEARARMRFGLLTAAAQEFSRHGYADTELERVANRLSSSVEAAPVAEAPGGKSYVRGGLYELFANKKELALAVVHMVEETWYEEVGYRLAEDSDPVETLIAVARGTADYLRHHPPVLRTLRAEFDGIDHPVSRAVDEAVSRMTDDVMQVVMAGRRTGAIPPGPPPRTLALAYLGALGGVVNHIDEPSPFEGQLAEKAALGVLGLAPMPASMGRTTSEVTEPPE